MERKSTTGDSRTRTAIVVALGGCLAVACVHPPTPRISDEFSYLLAADTFANGRLANPASPHPEFFDTPHVLQEPKYVSKYPPGQGLVLALGQVLTGHPIVGVWLSVMVACVGVWWMLRAIMPERWALWGGLVVALHPGVIGWWGNTYWGGAVAAAGGALTYGAAFRLWQRPSAIVSLVCGIGVVMLANTRPYEGLVASLPAAALVSAALYRVVRDRGWLDASRILMPAMLVVLGGAVWFGVYNRATTGDARTMPYQVYSHQYAVVPTFLWQSLRPVPEYRQTRIKFLFDNQERRTFERHQGWRPLVSRTLEKVGVTGSFFFGAALVPAFVALRRGRPRPVKSSPRSWTRFALIACGMSVMASLGVVSFFPHYLAPMTGPFLLLVIMGMRRLRTIDQWGRTSMRMLLLAHFAGSTIVLVASPVAHTARPWADRRADMNQELGEQGGRHLVLCPQWPASFHREENWVYNEADLEDAPVVWAWRWTADENRRLMASFEGRKTWLLVQDDPSHYRLEPYDPDKVAQQRASLTEE